MDAQTASFEPGARWIAVYRPRQSTGFASCFAVLRTVSSSEHRVLNGHALGDAHLATSNEGEGLPMPAIFKKLSSLMVGARQVAKVAQVRGNPTVNLMARQRRR